MMQVNHTLAAFLQAMCFSITAFEPKHRAPLGQAALRLTSALDHEVSRPLWWRLVQLMMHKWYPTNNFHTSFVFPAMQKTCLKYQHPSTTVWLWWVNLAIALASLVIPAHHSCVACSSQQGHSRVWLHADSGCLSLFLSRRIFICVCSPSSMKLLMKFLLTLVEFGIPQ